MRKKMRKRRRPRIFLTYFYLTIFFNKIILEIEIRVQNSFEKMTFDPRKCIEYSLWCGKKTMPKEIKNNKLYYRKGSSTECLKIGIGAGIAQEKKNHYKEEDVRNIRYIGDQYALNFKKKYKISTLTQLITKIKSSTKEEKKKILQGALTRRNGGLDKRAYNSVLIYLYNRRISNLPPCIKETKPKN